MKRTLFILCILLFLWIAGSSFWYVCKIKDHCKSEQAPEPDKELKEDTIEFKEADKLVEAAKDTVAVTIAETPVVKDSITIARDFIQNVQTKTFYFDFAKSETELSESDREYFEMVALYLENEPGKILSLSGHSDSNGSPEGNMYASYQRALFIGSLLKEAGIPESRMKSKSLGDKKPAESNETAEGRTKNRRVEITIKNI